MPIDELFRLFAVRGEAAYGGEAVSQAQHALQAADLARRAGAAPTLIAAALLHDVGHLLGDGDEGRAEQGVDAAHERLGADWLAARFRPETVEPVRLHVAAKRYLCATKAEYFARLSPGSVLSLGLQGGPMSAEEARAFEAGPYWRDALRLRAWDEAAKVPGAATAPLESHRAVLEASLL